MATMTASPATPTRGSSTTTGSAFGRHVRRTHSLGGASRKHATVLFADVNGSTALSRSIDLEEWWLVMTDTFDDMCEGVARFGGWVEGFTGDGIMAVFESAENDVAHALRGCRAALWLRDTMLRRSAELSRTHGISLSVRIGANSGEVLTGVLGRRRERCYTASGYEVALAKRIEGLATPGRVCISERTAELIGDACELRDLGAFDVKGAGSKVRAFELVADANYPPSRW